MSDKTPFPPCPAYEKLMRRYRNVGRLAAIAEIISRDFLTAMPEGAYANRVDQISYLQRRIHDDIVCCDAEAEIDEVQEHLEAHPSKWDEWHKANLTGMVNNYKKHAIMDHDLMEKSAMVANEGRRLHRQVLQDGDWVSAETHLEKVLDHTKKLAERKAKWRNSSTLYEALIQDHYTGFDLPTVWNWFNKIDA